VGQPDQRRYYNLPHGTPSVRLTLHITVSLRTNGVNNFEGICQRSSWRIGPSERESIEPGAADRGQRGEAGGAVSSERLDRLRLPLPAPAEQTHCAKAGGEEWERGGERRRGIS
jgi:hypothetical protein